MLGRDAGETRSRTRQTPARHNRTMADRGPAETPASAKRVHKTREGKFLMFSRFPGGTRVDVICLGGDKTVVNNRPASAITDLTPLRWRALTNENRPNVTGSQEIYRA